MNLRKDHWIDRTNTGICNVFPQIASFCGGRRGCAHAPAQILGVLLALQARGGAAGKPARPEFALAAGEVRAFCAGALGGAVGAALAVVGASDVRVAADGDGACLLHVPPAGAGGPGAPCMEAFSVHRPLLPDECAHHGRGGSDAAALGSEAGAADDLGPPDLCAEGAGAPAAPASAALAAATVKGGTLAAEAGDLGMGWLARLAALVSVGYAPEAGAGAPAPAQLDLTLHLQDCALRYEPPERAEAGQPAAPPVAAALLLGGAHIHVQPGDARLDLTVRGLSLFCAEAAARGPAWAPARAADLPRARLLDAGYSCVAQEGRIAVAIAPPAGPEGAPDFK